MSSSVAASRIGEFSRALASSVDDDLVRREGLDAFAVDGVVPAVIVSPSSEHEVSRALAAAFEFGLAAIPFGGGDHMTFGNMPAAYDVALATGRLHRIIAHEPADLTVTVEPGVRLSDLQAALASHNQFLPLDPPSTAAATIGGLVASGVSGPMRHAFGTARDWLIGIRVVHADGTISKAGGRVVKNVAGYEMTKLYAGSLGTLGVISEATFKLMPAPVAHGDVAAFAHSPHAAVTLAFAAHDAGLALHAVELLSPPAAFAVLGEPGWALLARSAGTPGAVARTREEITALAAGLQIATADVDGDAWRRWNDAFVPRDLALRISVQPSAVADAIEVLDRRFAGAGAMLSSTVGAGVIRANLRPGPGHRAVTLVAYAEEVASRHAGYAVVEAASASYKRDHDVFGPIRPDFSIMKRLKDEFDPRRTLAPGRFVGRI